MELCPRLLINEWLRVVGHVSVISPAVTSHSLVLFSHHPNRWVVAGRGPGAHEVEQPVFKHTKTGTAVMGTRHNHTATKVTSRETKDVHDGSLTSVFVF